MPERVGLVFRQQEFVAFVDGAFTEGVDSVGIRNRVTLTSGDVEAEARLDDGDLVRAGEVVRPLRVDVDAALGAAARAGALKDFDVVANGAAVSGALHRRVDD